MRGSRCQKLPVETDSPFANLGKANVEKVPRSAFLPESSRVDHDPKKYPTYVCPRCGMRQREFFTITDAPRQLEGPSSYLAVYFTIYVIASLFIFGLEEGWNPLDCIYFAVNTLTTAGLGDYVPTTDANKIICSIFIYFGVACIGLLLGSYIAGMLDERATQDRKSKLISSCPNCARIKTLRDSARIRHRKRALPEEVPLIEQTRLHRYSTASAITLESSINHEAVYVSGHHHHRNRSHSPDFNPQSPNGSVELGGRNSIGDNNVRSRSGLLPGVGNVLGSPVTRQILGRQKHTRHDSIDDPNLTTYGTGGASRRKYSVDFSFQTPTISESTPLQSNPTPDPTQQRNSSLSSQLPLYNDEHFSDSDDDSVTSSKSTSSESSLDEILDERQTRLKTAKYVLITLRQALLNSMVIIAVGCVGFWFIEGFSLVDGWYFTTVFLTTVGYGDIVPVTKGGKLFATIYILVAGTILLNNMSSISIIPLELRKRRLERAVLTQFGDQLDDSALRELATGPVIQRLRLAGNRPDGLDECTREMFSLAMLVRLGKVSEAEILQTFAAFRRLDVNDEGVLNSKSIIAAMIQKRRQEAASAGAEPPPPPPPPYPMEESDRPMETFWVGGTGSLHVATPSHQYHFSRDAHESDSNEHSALLSRSRSRSAE